MEADYIIQMHHRRVGTDNPIQQDTFQDVPETDIEIRQEITVKGIIHLNSPPHHYDKTTTRNKHGVSIQLVWRHPSVQCFSKWQC